MLMSKSFWGSGSGGEGDVTEEVRSAEAAADKIEFVVATDFEEGFMLITDSVVL